MLVFIIIATLIYLLKMLVDYVYKRTGMVSVAGIKGFMFGFDVEEVIVDYEDPDSKEVKESVQITVEIALFFVSIVFMWQEDIKSENQNDVY